jgi:hypothetical protein
MKTIVWATLTANGNYAQASAAHPPKPEALGDFAAHAKRVGNFIVGRRTFEAFQSDPTRKVDDAEREFSGHRDRRRVFTPARFSWSDTRAHTSRRPGAP